MTKMLEKMFGVIEAELDRREAVLADPITLRRMMADRIARAALLAIREPDAAMVKGGNDAMEGFMDDDLEPVFTAMIDAILTEGKAA